MVLAFYNTSLDHLGYTYSLYILKYNKCRNAEEINSRGES